MKIEVVPGADGYFVKVDDEAVCWCAGAGYATLIGQALSELHSRRVHAYPLVAPQPLLN